MIGRLSHGGRIVRSVRRISET